MRVGDRSSESGGASAYPDVLNSARAVPASGGANSFDALKAILEPLGR
jgi:hypothetical protein